MVTKSRISAPRLGVHATKMASPGGTISMFTAKLMAGDGPIGTWASRGDRREEEVVVVVDLLWPAVSVLAWGR